MYLILWACLNKYGIGGVEEEVAERGVLSEFVVVSASDDVKAVGIPDVPVPVCHLPPQTFRLCGGAALKDVEVKILHEKKKNIREIFLNIFRSQ